MRSERGLHPEPERTWPRKREIVACGEGGCPPESCRDGVFGCVFGRFLRRTATAWLSDTISLIASRARRMQSPSRCHGYTLLEMLVYVAVFAVGLNLFISLLGTGSRLSAMTTLSLTRMEGVREVREAFTQYTRRAAAVAPEAGGFKTGGKRLVLKMPPGQEEGFEYVVLGELREADRFAVMGLAERDGTLETVYMKTLRQPMDLLVFEVDGEGARPMVKLRLKVKGEEGERKQPFVEHASSATPRGVGG